MELPPEIWEIIFHHVQQRNHWTYADDLLSCSRACTTFQNILEANKCTWLFKNVLPCILHLLDKTTVLALRGVCMTWKLAVDHHLENYQHYYQKTKEVTVIQPFPYKRKIRKQFHPLGSLQWFTSFSSIENIENFLKSHSTHSFPGRSLSISYTSPIWNSQSNNLNPEALLNADRHREYFFGFISELLYQFGSKLFYLNIRIRSPAQEDFSLGIATGLNLTPNLRRLHLDIQFGNDGDDDHEGMQPLHLGVDIAELLPPLPNLECLEFTHNYISCTENYSSDRFQLRFASRYFSQLTKLQLMLDEFKWTPDFSGGEASMKWRGLLNTANLRELELKLVHGDYLNILELLAKAQSRLKILTLHLTYNVAQVPSFEMALNSTLPFSSSLEVLHVFSWGCYVLGQAQFIPPKISSEIQLQALQQLHSLKILQLHGFSFYYCNILDSLPSGLECLYLECPATTNFPYDLEYCEKSHMHSFTGAIWIKIPKLELVSLGHMTDLLVNDYNDEEREVQFKTVVYSRRRWEWEKMHGNYHMTKKQCRKKVDESKSFCFIL